MVVGRPTLLRAPTVVFRRGNISGEYVESGVVCDDESEVVCEDESEVVCDEDSVGERVTKGGTPAGS